MFSTLFLLRLCHTGIGLGPDGLDLRIKKGRIRPFLRFSAKLEQEAFEVLHSSEECRVLLCCRFGGEERLAPCYVRTHSIHQVPEVFPRVVTVACSMRRAILRRLTSTIVWPAWIGAGGIKTFRFISILICEDGHESYGSFLVFRQRGIGDSAHVLSSFRWCVYLLRVRLLGFITITIIISSLKME